MIDTSNEEIQSHYDFIVVGAGAANRTDRASANGAGARTLGSGVQFRIWLTG